MTRMTPEISRGHLRTQISDLIKFNAHHFRSDGLECVRRRSSHGVRNSIHRRAFESCNNGAATKEAATFPAFSNKRSLIFNERGFAQPRLMCSSLHHHSIFSPRTRLNLNFTMCRNFNKFL